MSRRMFTKEFKVLAAQRMLRGESGSELARELEVKRTKLYEWAAELERYGDEAFPGPGRRAGNQPRVQPAARWVDGVQSVQHDREVSRW